MRLIQLVQEGNYEKLEKYSKKKIDLKTIIDAVGHDLPPFITIDRRKGIHCSIIVAWESRAELLSTYCRKDALLIHKI